MAHIAKATYTRAIPADAEKCTHRGRKAVRWKGRSGKWVNGIICEENPERCLVESSTWYVELPNGERHKGFRDRAATEALAARLSLEYQRKAAGAPAPRQTRPVSDLINAWEAYLRGEGNTQKHASRQANRVRLVARAADARIASDLTPAAVLAAIAEAAVLKGAKGEPTDKKVNSTTRNHYVGACKQFTRWLALVEKCEPTDYLSGLSRKSDDSDRRRVRRILPPNEFESLLAAAESGKVVKGLTGRERRIMYLVAANTGLRCSELASLAPVSFDLDGAPPTVTVAAAYSKNRRQDTLPLPLKIVPAVKALLSERKPHERVWPARKTKGRQAWYGCGAEMVAHDLGEAGIPYVDDQGLVYDFHALRSQYITGLDAAGVSLAKAQKLARHSTPVLTSNYYTRIDLKELGDEVNKLR